MAKGKKKKRDKKNKKEASGNSKRSAHDTHVAVMLSKAAKDRRLFDKYVAAGAGMQGGARPDDGLPRATHGATAH